MKVVRKTYRFIEPDGSTKLRTVLCCPGEGCEAEFDDWEDLSGHAAEVHGLIVAGQPAGSSGSRVTQKVTRLHLPGGQRVLVCPLCEEQLPDDEALLFEHMASLHSLALREPGRSTGDSEHLDRLHQSCASNWMPLRQAVLEKFHVVSLGSFCGMKCTLQRLGLGTQHFPFDWIRSSSAGLIHFLTTGFEDFFSVAVCCDVPATGKRMYRSERHSFWHDEIGQPETQAKLWRRVKRFLSLAKAQEGKDLLFLRSVASSDEVAQAEELYDALVQCFHK